MQGRRANVKWMNDKDVNSKRVGVSCIGERANDTHAVKECHDFVSRIKNISPENYCILCLDVTSLFTNVPAEEALNCLKISMRVFQYTEIEIKKILCVTRLYVEEIAFILNDTFYKQLDGIAMDSPISKYLCDIDMHYFEGKLLNILNIKC